MSATKTFVDLLMNRDKVYILPTRFGLGFCFVNLAILMSATTYANNLAYLLSFCLFAVMMLSLIQTHFNFKSVYIDDVSIDGGHADQYINVNIVLKNPTAFDCNLILCQALFKDIRIKNYSNSVTVKSHDGCFVQISVPVEKRGLYTLKGIQLSSVFPLGLWNTWKYHKISREAFVYPRIQGQQSLPQPLTTARAESGLDRSGGDDFSGLRNYFTGDSIRHVDWKAHARTGNLFVKKFDDGGEATYDFRWVDVHSLDTEERVSQLARWIVDAAQKQEAFALTLPNQRVEADKGNAHLKYCLELLAVYENRTQKSA